MRRGDFNDWGKELSEEAFWQAVAAAGVSEGYPPRSGRRLAEDVDARRPLLWRLPSAGRIREIHSQPRSWCSLFSGPARQGRPRLEIDAGGVAAPGELIHGLLRFAARSLYVALPAAGEASALSWRRPLRIGFLPAQGARDLARRFDELHRSRAETHRVGATKARAFDLLVVPASLAEAREALSGSLVAVRATVLLLLGGRGHALDWAFAFRQIQELRELTQAHAVVAAGVGERGAVWLADVAEKLAQGSPLDLAVQTPDLLPETEAAIVFAEPGLMSDSDQGVRGIFRTDRSWSIERGEDDLEPKPEGSYGLEEREPFLTRSRPRRHPRDAQERYLQAGILEQGRPVRAIESGRSYDVSVRIAPPGHDAVAADRPFPDETLPESEQGHLLTVLFSAPDLFEKPRLKTLRLPPRGPSTACTFELPVPAGAGSVSARLTVLFENRVLQTALLQGEVGAPLRLYVEMDLRPGMQNLSRQPLFDGALVLGEPEDGAARATMAGGYRPATFSVVGLEQAIEAMEARIDATPWSDPDFASFDSPGSVALLVFLAAHGERLYRELLRYAPGHPFLTGDGPVQLVSTEHGARLPLEFLYSRAAPDDDAGLCPNWRGALAAGVCDCPDDGSVICPLGFWCFRRVIERHRFSPDHAKETEGRAYALKDVLPGEDSAVLEPLAGVAFGASQRVGSVAGSLEKVLEALEKTFARKVAPARDWGDWSGQVQRASPSLLLLLPHTEKNDLLLPALEIGGAALASNKLRREHVLGPAGDPKPVVLLLGCNTDNAGLPFESFVPAFADQQAAVVVTSLSKVLGRHAAPLAALFLERLAAFPNDGSRRFGEVMREVRRSAALTGPPLALVLKAYGDADWRI